MGKVFKTALLMKMQQILLDEQYTDASLEQISKASIQVLIYMYGGKQSDFLNKLRYAKFMKMVLIGKILVPRSCHQQME